MKILEREGKHLDSDNLIYLEVLIQGGGGGGREGNSIIF